MGTNRGEQELTKVVVGEHGGHERGVLLLVYWHSYYMDMHMGILPFVNLFSDDGGFHP